MDCYRFFFIAKRRGLLPRPAWGPAARTACRRPREIRDITVPIGTSSIAGDLGVRKLLDVAQPHRLTERLGQRVERRLQVRVERRPRQHLLGRLLVAADVGGPLDRLAVDVHRVAAVVPAHVPKRVVEDREQPRLQVRPALELRRGPERLQVRVLHQILGIRRPPGQAQRRAVEAVDVRQRLG